ncbi:MAG: hypothetical protein ACRD3J_14435 [Thermoanaerobaculia bacterium]
MVEPVVVVWDVVDVVDTRGRVSPGGVAIDPPPPVSVAVVPLVDDAVGAVGGCDVSVSAVLPLQPAQIVITARTTNNFEMLIHGLLIDIEQSSRPVGVTCEQHSVEVVYG